MKKGKLIVFEGPDGVGKTTLARKLVRALRHKDINSVYASFPGCTPKSLGKLVYELHHSHDSLNIGSVTPEAMQLLHIAAQFDTITNEIKPALEEGKYVILDRFYFSTLVYGSIFGVNEDFLSKALELLTDYWGDLLVPDEIFILERDEPFESEPDEYWYTLKKKYHHLWKYFEVKNRKEDGFRPDKTLLDRSRYSFSDEDRLLDYLIYSLCPGSKPGDTLIKRQKGEKND